MAVHNWSQSLSVSVDEHYEHSFKRLTLIIFSIITLIASIVLNILFVTGFSVFGFDVFPSSSRSLYNEFQTHMTPSKLIIYLWILVFAWQLMWLIYGISTIFRKSSSDYLYKYPPVMHWLVYFNFSASNLLYIICLIFWSRKMFFFAACYSILTFIGLYIGAFTSLFKLSDYQREMYYTEKFKDVWSIRILVQNGLFMYATWTFIIFMITLDITLVHEFHIPKDTVHTICVVVLFIKVVVYFLIENFIAYRYCKFMFTPWIILGIYILDSLITQTIINHKFKFYDQITPIRVQYLEDNFSYTKLNFNLFLHTCLVGFFVFLFISKLVKFIWQEICYQKKFAHNF